MDHSKYDGTKYADVEDVVAAVEPPSRKKWSTEV